MNALDELQGMFTFQASKLDGAEKEAYNKVQSSINTTARLFQHLLGTHDDYLAKEGLKDVKPFLEKIIEDTLSSFSFGSDRISSAVKIDSVYFKPEQMYAIGNIVNELMVNSAKHAFGDKSKKDHLEVSLIKEKEFVLLELKDDGPGLLDINASTNHSLGMSMVKILAASLSARFEMPQIENGACFKFEIPY